LLGKGPPEMADEVGSSSLAKVAVGLVGCFQLMAHGLVFGEMTSNVWAILSIDYGSGADQKHGPSRHFSIH
jgi:hypothetical protein